jgi:hypothetical protein
MTTSYKEISRRLLSNGWMHEFNKTLSGEVKGISVYSDKIRQHKDIGDIHDILRGIGTVISTHGDEITIRTNGVYVKPKSAWIYDRWLELTNAIAMAKAINQEIPIEWVDELEEIKEGMRERMVGVSVN